MRPLIDCVPISRYEGLYVIHPSGTIFSLDREELMTGRHPDPYYRKRKGGMLVGKKSNAGYLQVGLYRDGVCKRFTVHRLVAQHFLQNPDNLPEVNHIDENRTNNRVENLEWCTRSQNAKHSSYKNRGSRSGSAKLCENEVEDIVKYLKAGISQTRLADWYGVSNHTIHKIKSGKNWAWSTGLDKEGI